MFSKAPIQLTTDGAQNPSSSGHPQARIIQSSWIMTLEIQLRNRMGYQETRNRNLGKPWIVCSMIADGICHYDPLHYAPMRFPCRPFWRIFLFHPPSRFCCSPRGSTNQVKYGKKCSTWIHRLSNKNQQETFIQFILL